ncbi:MAG: lysophospholipid acyltransferase family protein [Sphingomicrobium sp.]|nr:1-acyl-sn-glycerol-3-phosphate acyltransferase [Sphingomonadales bacterium]
MTAAGRIAALALLLLVCLGPHLIAKSIGRSRWPRRFLKAAARTCGARVTTEGEGIAPHSLILANHSSWLDILLLAGATGTRFVSKAEVRDHWLLRWLADQNDTIYIERQDRRAVHGQAAEIAHALADPRPLALFPEGTTGDGRELLPFRPSLLAAVAPAPAGVDVRPVAIDYGAMRTEIGWSDGESGKANALRLLGRRGTFPVVVRLLAPLASGEDRKAMARDARGAIEDALAASNLRTPAL